MNVEQVKECRQICVEVIEVFRKHDLTLADCEEVLSQINGYLRQNLKFNSADTSNLEYHDRLFGS